MTSQGHQVQQPMLFSDQNCLKPFMKDEFDPLETTPSSKGFVNNFQDFHDHHLEHQIDHVNGSSSNPVFGLQTTCYDPFDHASIFPHGYSANNDIDFYECKPFAADHGNVGHGQVMDNFQSGGFFNLSQRVINSDDIIMGSSENVGFNLPFDHFQEIKTMNFVVPDELSCVTAENAYYKKAEMNKNKALASTKKNSKVRKKSVVKGQWSTEEDRKLVQLVEQYGLRKWSHIAQMLPGRIGKQCRERWHNHLRPDIKRDTWTEEEDRVLIETHIELGNKWAEIAKRLPGRTENSIKNHWNATKRRQYSKRKCRSKYPRGSMLQDYIRSLNLDNQPSCSNRCQGKTSNININGIIAADINASAKVSTYQPTQALEFCPSNDRLVPEYDFNEVPDFSFDEKLMLQETCSLDSLLDEIPGAPIDIVADAYDHHDPGKSFKIDLMGLEVKKELDLIEMISGQQPNV
ncbi:hypothetical protein CCACVL1_24505 [Corchorus capsularis]|uniref:SANT/Myb domain-containing protein n=1 Tax=Corchorus capsularis TaxID=210143 RepID=A0A1R3GPH7_COCAP|nr:hypothetical protein CCACVL1_24505 [Corchorus capsularis]